MERLRNAFIAKLALRGGALNQAITARTSEHMDQRWIRIGVAHEYLGIGRDLFNERVRPHVRVMQLSPQTKVVPRADLDAIADVLESACDGASRNGGNVWDALEAKASVSIDKVDAALTRSTKGFESSFDSVRSRNKKPKQDCATRLIESTGNKRLDEVIVSCGQMAQRVT